MSHPDDDVVCNTSANPHFQDIIQSTLQNPARRNLMRGGIGLAALSTVPFLAACGGGDDDAPPGAKPKETSLGFNSVGKSLLDDVVLPVGYSYQVLHATGDRLDSNVAPYSSTGAETDDWARRVGDHHDAMDIFYIDRKGRFTTKETGRAVLCVNHESSADAHFFHPRGQTSAGQDGKKFSQFGNWDLGERPELEVLKEINHHGVSIVELTKKGNNWSYQLNAPLNLRVTAQSPMKIGGPAADLKDIQAFMVTQFDPTGATSRGTLNNCGHGKTPWGTYLTCEENWAFYFHMPKGSNPVDDKLARSRARFGVARVPLADSATAGPSQGWHTVSDSDDRFSRWNVSAVGSNAAEDFRNEPNTFGYNVEIDPLDPNTTPVKRVAMGRFAHEGAVCSIPKPGKPLAFYMGCDARNEYIYKFVSAARWTPSDEGRGLAAGDKYLNEGRLYAARFNEDGTGEWLELTIKDPRISGYAAYSFANQADVFVNARHAADAVVATKMDRPEWAAVNPKNGEVYVTLTNNVAALRSPTTVDAANPRSYEDIDGRMGTGNPNGHIIRFREKASLADATSFNWDIFLFGAEEDAGDANLSKLTEKNAFSSPDGLWFSPASGICWIQTDDGAMTDESNCMMLAAIPGEVGDGGPVVANNRVGAVTGTQKTFMGALLGEARLRRFLVGPPGCEITGVTESPDGKTMFVNIQHPGENTRALGAASAFTLESDWPGTKGYGKPGRPRSATIVITRKDGRVIGL